MKAWFTLAAALVVVTACGQEQRKETPAAPVVETASTSSPVPTQAPATPTAPAPTTPTTPTTPAPTTPTPPTPALDCSDMQAILQQVANGGDFQQIAQECLQGMGGAGLPGGLPGLPTGGNTP